ncbi:MAG: 23S rRNA (guanosine(2251)-2'-O)-methyltransferase RlmB [Bacteroidales bacterium]
MSIKKNLIYGIHPLQEALLSGKPFDKIFIRKGLKGENISRIKEMAGNFHIPLQQVPVEKLNRLTGKNHQGVVGLVAAVDFFTIEDIVPALYEQAKIPFILILDQISDIRNFGAICRTAEAAGVHAIVIPAKGAAGINEDAMKTSAGALNLIPLCRSHNLPAVCRFLKNSGINLMAASEKAAVIYQQADMQGPLAIIMGAEDKGIQAELLQYADMNIKLPMKGVISSLNVSVAAGILMYEVVRQRDISFKKN